MEFTFYGKIRHQPFMGLIGRREAARIQFITPAMQKKKDHQKRVFSGREKKDNQKHGFSS